MTDYALLISPLCAAAFFAQAREIAIEELRGVLGQAPEVLERGGMTFLIVPRASADPVALCRLASVQGVFTRDGDVFRPLDTAPGFQLHRDFVWGEKYRGKTNETLTQLLINLALQTAAPQDPRALRLLDPMCGRGTSLLWAMRYGISATGIEQDGTVLREMERSLKKWTKLHRQSHKLSQGWVQKANKRGIGKFLAFSSGDAALQVVIGDTADSDRLMQRKKADLLVTDLPYGVEHRSAQGTRNPLETVEAAAPAWARALAPGGAMAIAFNAYLPKRDALLRAFDGLGLESVDRPFRHRMSEALVRDILLLKKPAEPADPP